MNRHIIYSVFGFCAFFFYTTLQSCGTGDNVEAPVSFSATAYVNFGHKAFGTACKATGICDIQNAVPGQPLKNTSFQYVVCQRADNTDSLSISFFPAALSLIQDSSHFQLDQQGRYAFDVDYVFDSLDAVTTNIASGTIIPGGNYETQVSGQQNQTKWTVLIPRVLRPGQGNK